MLKTPLTATDWPSASTLPYQATRRSLAVETVFASDLDVQHPYGTHSMAATL